METKNAYREKLAAQLKEWTAQINLLEAKIENVGADMRLKRDEELRQLRARQHAAAEKMQELSEASGEAWDKAKVTADQLWEDLKVSIKDVRSKF